MRRTDNKFGILMFVGFAIIWVGGLSEFSGAHILMYGGFGVSLVGVFGLGAWYFSIARQWYLRQGRKVQKLVLQGFGFVFASILFSNIHFIVNRKWVPETIPIFVLKTIEILIPLSMMAGLILLVLAYSNSRKR